MSCQLILGPMFAGKTIELVARCRTHTVSGKRCVVVTPDIDTRATMEGAIFTHARGSETDLFNLPVQKFGTNQNILPSVYDFDVVAIDEGQFVPNLDKIAKDLIQRNKIVIIAALNGKSDTTSWQSVSKIIPLCDDITFLKSVCEICKKWTATTSKLRDEHTNNPIGGTEKYMALCLICRFH